MTKIKEGSIELHMKNAGVHYALYLKLDDFPTEEKLIRGLRNLSQCLRATLIEQGHWLKKGKNDEEA